MNNQDRKWVSGKVGKWAWAWAFLLTHTLTGLLTHSAPAATTNWPVQYSTPDYQLLTTNFFKSNFFIGTGSTNMAITYDGRGRPTFWFTNFAGGGSGTATTNFEVISALSMIVSNEMDIKAVSTFSDDTMFNDAAYFNNEVYHNGDTYLNSITGSSLLRVDGGDLIAAATIGNGIDWDGSTIAVDGNVTNGIWTRVLNLIGATNGLDANLTATMMTVADHQTEILALDDKVFDLEGATNGLHNDILNLQAATNSLTPTNIASRLGVPLPPTSGGRWLIDDEFDGDITTRSLGRHPWLTGNAGGGALNLSTNFTGGLSIKEIITTNASSSDRAGMVLNSNLNGLTNAEYWCVVRVALGTLDYAGNTNMFRVGLGDSTTTEAANGIYWKNQSNTWYAVCARGGTRTVGIINSNSVQDAWVELAWYLDETGTNVNFYMGGQDGALVFQTNLTSRIPYTPGVLLNAQVMQHKFVGITDRMTNYVDYFKLWAKPRY